jgi:hypothetical protein
VTGIGVKLERGRNKSLISQSKNNSKAFSELEKSSFSFLSTVESSGIKGAMFNYLKNI